MKKEYRNKEKWLGKTFGERKIVDIISGKNLFMWVLECPMGHKNSVKPYNILKGRNLKCKNCSDPTTAGGNTSRNWKGGKYISASSINTWERSARLRNLSWEIDLSFLEELLETQNWKCALSGEKLTVGKGDTTAKRKWNLSPDRIDSNLHYTKDNVQFVTKQINMIKKNLANDEFIKLCKNVANHNP